jgi:hypothetical protein
MTTPRKRGRPTGSTPNREHDERLLRQAARKMFYGLSENATAAFRSLLKQDSAESETVLRRLQRRWQDHRERYLEEARRDAFSRRWKFEADELAKASPELSRTIDIFVASAAGKALLLKYGRDGVPAEPMSLGLMTLWEEIVRHSATGPLRAEQLFDQTYTGWSATGLEPDEAFLRRFAELCLAQADRLKAHAGTGAARDDATGALNDAASEPEGPVR